MFGDKPVSMMVRMAILLVVWIEDAGFNAVLACPAFGHLVRAIGSAAYELCGLFPVLLKLICHLPSIGKLAASNDS